MAVVSLISAWLRVIRVRFLLASVIAVSVALALAARQAGVGTIDMLDAVLTLAGVMALHASVDMLNDYSDYKRGIDTATERTKVSGGTGVLPEGLLKPSSVYRAGIVSLLLGASIGAYFVVTHGVVIAIILGFAILSIYFYSGRIVDTGLGELFVAVKGCMIVLGAFYIQTGDISASAVLAGIAVGSLSSLVLFVASFPDHDADKSKGRRTIAIMLGKRRAARVFWLFFAAAYMPVAYGALVGVLPHAALAMFAVLPLGAYAGIRFGADCAKPAQIVEGPISRVLLFCRAAGALLVAGVLASVWCLPLC